MEEYTNLPGADGAVSEPSVQPEAPAQVSAPQPEAPACPGCASGAAGACGGCGGESAPACGGCCGCTASDGEPAQEATPQSEEGAEAPAEKPVETVTVADIRFRNNVKTYFFDPGELTLKPGDHVIMDTSRGVEYGVCAVGNHAVPASEIVPPLRKILRRANAQDERVNSDNLEKEKRAFSVCMQKIEDHHLEMQLVSAECAFDGSKILFFFTADGRVDFRELVKDLASVFRTRIELRQIGVRDKAKMVGGLGVCGRPFCCREFLDDFQPVSIKMAKTQNLSLNPTKISGVCGRLMCCLKYEQDAYEDLLRTAPKNESFVDTPDGRGTVTEVNLLRQSVKVRMEDHPETIGTYKNSDICVLRSGKARKNDPPIPKDLAPISSRPRPVKKQPEEFEPLPDVIYPDDVAVVDRAPAAELPSELQPMPAQSADAPAAGNKPRRRRGRGHGGAKPADAEARAPQEAPAQEPKQPREPKPQKPKAPQSDRPKQPADRPKGERRPQKPQEPRENREPREPKEPKPQREPKAPNAQADAPAAEGGAPNPNRRRRRYRGHRGGNGGAGQSGGAPSAE